MNFRRGTLTPFAQVLLGGILASGGIGMTGPVDHYAMTAGGGLDYKVSRLIAIRLAQAEYFMTKFPDGLDNGQNNFRNCLPVRRAVTRQVRCKASRWSADLLRACSHRFLNGLLEKRNAFVCAFETLDQKYGPKTLGPPLSK